MKKFIENSTPLGLCLLILAIGYAIAEIILAVKK